VEAIENIIGDIRMSKLNGIKRYLYIRERGKEWRLRITNLLLFLLFKGVALSKKQNLKNLSQNVKDCRGS